VTVVTVRAGFVVGGGEMVTLVIRCGRCRTRLDAPPQPTSPAGGFWWPCPVCEPEAYHDGYFVPTTAPEWFRPGDVRFVETAKQ
jgi:hypothetical protein